MKIELVASDLDGTLLGSDGRVSRRTREAVHRVRRSVPVLIATGRPPRWVYPVADDLEHHHVAVCANGAITVDLSDGGRVLDSSLLSHSLAQNVVAAVRSVLPDASFAVDQLAGFAHAPNYVPTWELPDDVVVAPIEELIAVPCFKLLFRHHRMSTDYVRKITEAIGSNGSVTYGASGSFSGTTSLADVHIEVMAPGVSKASALHRYCETQGIDPSAVVVFGDMPNDLDMIRWAGHGVAMANGHADVRDAAHEVALTNNDHGVAVVLDRLIP
jgi:Cof subfamily protein (haloacid dehalogenase superfamily)